MRNNQDITISADLFHLQFVLLRLLKKSNRMKNIVVLFMVVAFVFGCTQTSKKENKMDVNQEIMKKACEFASFTLTTDLTVLTEKERQMLPLLLEAAKVMEEIY